MPVFVGAGTSSFMKGDGGVGFSTGTTTTRNALSGARPGQIIFNHTTGLPEYYNGADWVAIDSPPGISNISPSSVESAAGGNVTFTITGERFGVGATVQFISNTGVTLTASPVTRVSATQLTAVIARNSFVNAQEPYDVQVINASGLSATLADVVNVDNAPAWNTSSGTLATISDQVSANHATLSATDPEGDTVTYSETGSALSSAGLNINSSTGVITGDPNDVSSSTTISFTGRATANSKTADRSFNIIVDPYREVYFGILGGAGGGGGRRTNSYQGSTNDRGRGGAGCFVQAVYEIKLGTTIYWYVGAGGNAGSSSSGGSSGAYSGHGGTTDYDTGGAGGDFSGIFTANSISQTNALIIAGGGGGGAGRPHAGNDSRGTQYGGGGCESATTGEGNDGGRGLNTPNHSHGSDRGGQGGQQNNGGAKGTANNEYNTTPVQTDGSALNGGVGGAGVWGGGGGGGAGFFGGGGGSDDGNSWGGQGGGAGSSFIRGKITNYSTSAFNSVSAANITYVSGTFRTQSFSEANDGNWAMGTPFDFTSAGFGSGWAQSNSVTPGMGGRENTSYPGSGTAGGDGLVFYRIGASGSYTKFNSAGSLTALVLS